VLMTATAGATPRLITPAEISRGRFGRRNGRPQRRVITSSSFAPRTAKATCRNLKKIAVGSLASPDFIKLSCASRRELLFLGSTGCQPVDLGSLPRSGNGVASSCRVHRCRRQGCRQQQAGSLCSPEPVQLASCAKFYRWRKSLSSGAAVPD